MDEDDLEVFKSPKSKGSTPGNSRRKVSRVDYEGFLFICHCFITKPKAKSGNYQRERPMLHMLKLKSPENAR